MLKKTGAKVPRLPSVEVVILPITIVLREAIDARLRSHMPFHILLREVLYFTPTRRHEYQQKWTEG